MKSMRPRTPRVRLAPREYQDLCREVLERDHWRCQKCGAMTSLQVHHLEFRSHFGSDSEENLVTFYPGKLRGWPVFLKRAMDLCLTLIAIILSFPILIIVSLAIKFTSPGPILFIQNRVGLNKRRIRIYKFRTMVPDAEQKLAELEHLNEVEGPAFKIKNDPRITPLGRFLRRTSLDELPQLFNVLKGDMSLVGPRPLPLRDYNGFSEDWQRRRFSVRPGLTCLWQINGRSMINFDKWMKFDMEYIDNWSLWLDLKIMLKTIPAVFKGSGAV